jgi:hypothetical protein
MRILIVLMLSGTLGLIGCGSSSSNSGGSGGNGGSAGSGGTAGMGGEGGTAGMGGEGGTGGAVDPAAAFCTDYGDVCGFDSGGHANQDDCETAFSGYDADRQACVVMHLGFAASDTTTHCPHAAGAAPCN